MRISKRDWAQLSAYLDGELNQRELRKFQNRIESEPVLQAALEDLRTVKTVLSHTPQLTLPRNFTLRRSLVESPQRRSPVRGYRLAAAALSFLFVGVVVFDFGSSMMKGGLSASQAPMVEEVMMEAVADEMEEPAILAKQAEAEGEVPPAAEMEMDAEAPENLDASEEAELAGMAEGESNIASEEAAERAYSGEEETPREKTQDDLGTPAPTEWMESEATPIPAEPEIEGIREPLEIPWLAILEIIFGLGAIGFGLAAWWNRRKNRKI